MIDALLLALVAQVTPQRDTPPVTAPAHAAISGTVVSDANRPLRRVRVTVLGSSLAAPRSAITEDDGAFRVAGLAPGRYTVTAAKEGYVSMAFGASRSGRPGLPITLGDRGTVTISIRLPRGAVITGTVTDIDGLPAQGVTVIALQRRLVAGEPRYVPVLPAAPSQAVVTDDRGVYRIYGLAAGDYIIATQVFTREFGRVTQELRVMGPGGPSPTLVSLAQVFYPSTVDIARASRLSLHAGEERGGIDLQLQYVPLATVSGSLSTVPQGAATMIMLARTDDVTGPNAVYTARAGADGRFSFNGVSPGHYRALARTTYSPGLGGVPPAGPPTPVQISLAEVAVNGEDIDGVALSLQPTLSIAGRVVFEGASAPQLPPSLRVNVPSALAIANLGMPIPSVQVSGTTFKVENIIPGSYRLMGAMQGVRAPVGRWWLKSLTVDGRELLDAPLDLRSSSDNAIATLTDRVSELSGVITESDGSANPASDVSVVAFGADRTAWFFNSRRIATGRSDAAGRYVIRNLPAGEYRVIATRELDANEWFDPEVLERLLPRSTAVTITGPTITTVNLQAR